MDGNCFHISRHFESRTKTNYAFKTLKRLIIIEIIGRVPRKALKTLALTTMYNAKRNACDTCI